MRDVVLARVMYSYVSIRVIRDVAIRLPIRTVIRHTDHFVAPDTLRANGNERSLVPSAIFTRKSSKLWTLLTGRILRNIAEDNVGKGNCGKVVRHRLEKRLRPVLRAAGKNTISYLTLR